MGGGLAKPRNAETQCAAIRPRVKHEAICYICTGRSCRGLLGVLAPSVTFRKRWRMGGPRFGITVCLSIRRSSFADDVVLGLAAVQQDTNLDKDSDFCHRGLCGECRDADDLGRRSGSSPPGVDLRNRRRGTGSGLFVALELSTRRETDLIEVMRLRRPGELTPRRHPPGHAAFVDTLPQTRPPVLNHFVTPSECSLAISSGLTPQIEARISAVDSPGRGPTRLSTWGVLHRLN